MTKPWSFQCGSPGTQFCLGSTDRGCVQFAERPPVVIWSQAVRASVAAVTDSDRVVPASRGHRPGLCGAGAAHALSAGPAVVLGNGRGESLGAEVALRDVVVGNPVVGTSNVLHET